MLINNIYICKHALKNIFNEITNNPNTETGGILIGYKSKDSMVVVHATGPGPKAFKSKLFLMLDTDHIRKELKFFENTYNFGYEGSWHKHPTSDKLFPSFIDKWLMKKVVRSKNYDVDQALLILTNQNPISIDDLACFVFKKNSKEYAVLKPFLAKDII